MKFFARLRLKRQRERELDEEIRAHLAMASRERMEQGESPAEAEANSLREFGNTMLVKEVTRDMWGWRWLEALLQDARYGLRQLRHNPGFTAVAVITLALGIGANTAIFSLLDPLLLRELPVRNPQELVCISSAGTLGNEAQGYISEVQAYYSYRDDAQAFSGVAAYTPPGSYKVTIDGRTNTADGEIVSENYFRVLGVQPYWGSPFTRANSQSAPGNPVVLSFEYWRKALTGDRNAIGKVILVDKIAYTIAGVTPPEFFGTEVGESPAIYLPLDGRLSESDRERAEWVTILARLKPGVSIAQAGAGLTPLFKQMVRASTLPEVTKREHMARLLLTPANRGLSDLRQRFGGPAVILMVIVGLVLVIACANVANLFLAFGASRRREIALRLTMGAGRWRLVRLLLVRAALVAIAGAAVGLLAAKWTAAILVGSLSTAGSPVMLQAGVSLRVLVFTIAVTGLAVLLAALMPALSATRVKLSEDLRMHPGAGILSPRSRVGKTLLLAQISICVVLLAGAGLLLRSLVKLETFNPGFDRDHVLAVSLRSAARDRTVEQQKVSYGGLLARVRALPGVRSAAYSAYLPISGREFGINITVEGHTLSQGETANTLFDEVSPGYFETMGIPLVMGRDFQQQDPGRRFHVAVINQTMARRFFGPTNPLGKHFSLVEGHQHQPIEIIGVVADSKYTSLREKTQDCFYVPVAYGRTLDVRTSGNPGAIAGTVRKAIQLYGGSIEVTGIQTLREQIDESLHQDRLVTALCSAFGVLALALTCVGLYGVLSLGVAQRTNEMGVRAALGASPADIYRLVVGQGIRLAAIGLALGIVAALCLTRFMESLIYDVKPTDPLTLAGVSVVLIGVALLASWVPARRAMKVDPMTALRHE